MSSEIPTSPLVDLNVDLEDDVSLQILNSHNKTIVHQTGSYNGQHPPGRYVIQVERHGLLREKSVWLTPKRGIVKLSQAFFELTYRSAAPCMAPFGLSPSFSDTGILSVPLCLRGFFIRARRPASRA